MKYNKWDKVYQKQILHKLKNNNNKYWLNKNRYNKLIEIEEYMNTCKNNKLMNNNIQWKHINNKLINI